MVALPFIIKFRFWRGRTPARALVLCGSAEIPYALFCFSAFSFAPVAHGGVFLNGCLPIFTAITARLWIGQRSHLTQVLGMAAILVGVSLVGLEGIMNNQDGKTWIGDLLFLCSVLLFGIFMVASRLWQITPGQNIFAITFLSGLIYIPVWCLVLKTNLSLAPWSEIIIQGGYQGIITSLGGFSCTAIAINNLGASRASAYMPAVPVVSTLMAVPILGEVPGLRVSMGLLVVTAGIAFALGLFSNKKETGS